MIVKEGRSLVPAVVLVDRGKKLDVVLAGGKTISLAPGKISLSLGPLFRGKPVADEASAWLSGWQDQLRAETETLSLPLIWEILEEEQTSCSLDQLCELQADQKPTPILRAAMHLALETDTRYFKRRKELYNPRPREEVAAIELAAERKLARESAEAAFIALLVAAQNQPAACDDPSEAIAGFVADLRRLALGDIETAEVKRATRLLEATPHLPATADGAFRALVSLGIFEPDEHLALLASGLPLKFRPAELALAERLDAPAPVTDEQDLRALATVTIDEPWTQDPDDALSLEPLSDGLRLWIHITHVSRYILPGSPLDQAAFDRGSSLYLPEGVRPMLPPDCVRQLALTAGQDHLALTAEFELSFEGELRSERFYPTRIHIDRNWCYGDVDQQVVAGASPFAELSSLATQLQARRREQGATEFSLPEISLKIEADQVVLTRLPGHSPARRLVAELMILANARWAEFCFSQQIPVVYRKQDAPAEALPPVSDFSDPYLFFFAIRRQLTAGRLSTQPAPHAGLGLARYLQATSPLRRYQDLAAQRQLSAVLAGDPPPYDTDEILRIAAAADSAAREISRLERDRREHWILRYLEQRVGQTFDALVLGELGPKRYQILLNETLTEQPIRCDQPLKAGETVQVRLAGLNVFGRQLQLVMAQKSDLPL